MTGTMNFVSIASRCFADEDSHESAVISRRLSSAVSPWRAFGLRNRSQR